MQFRTLCAAQNVPQNVGATFLLHNSSFVALNGIPGSLVGSGSIHSGCRPGAKRQVVRVPVVNCRSSIHWRLLPSIHPSIQPCLNLVLENHITRPKTRCFVEQNHMCDVLKSSFFSPARSPYNAMCFEVLLSQFILVITLQNVAAARGAAGDDAHELVFTTDDDDNDEAVLTVTEVSECQSQREVLSHCTNVR